MDLIAILYIPIYFLVFALGSCIGSFLNVVIYRIPAKISIIYPPSHCPKCDHRLGKTENIPVFGWLSLRGRCRWCHAPISFRYPLIETITGLLFVLITIQFGFTFIAFGYCCFISWLIALALIDFDTMILPNTLTQSGLVVGLVFHSLLGFFQGDLSGFANHLFLSILSAVVAIWLFDFILIVGTLLYGKPAMGGGDPKLAAMIGAWLGWQNLLLTAFIACGIGVIIGVSAIVLGLLKKGNPIPFGPFLVLGAILTMFFGESLLSIYFNLMGLSS